MLDWFYTVSRSPDPLVLMVNGIDLHRKGTLEARPWQPWEGIEGQSHRTRAPWRSGEYFWDIDRIEGLGVSPFFLIPRARVRTQTTAAAFRATTSG